MYVQQYVHSCHSKIATDRAERVEEAARIHCYLTHELQTHAHSWLCMHLNLTIHAHTISGT